MISLERPPLLRLLVASAILSVIAWYPAHAQQATPPRHTRLAQFSDVISALEAEGRRHPSASDVASDRRCRDVSQVPMGPAPSGDFEVRGFDNYAWSWYRGVSKLTWWPKYPRVGDTLTVRVVRADQRADTAVFKFRGPVRVGGNRPYMYPSDVRVPRPGPWVMVATAGANWGCFFYDLPATRPAASPRPQRRQ